MGATLRGGRDLGHWRGQCPVTKERGFEPAGVPGVAPRASNAGHCPAWQAIGVGRRTGPLEGLKVIEVASLAPAPFGCMVLADLGAEVLRIDRPDRSGRQQLPPVDPLCRSRRSIRLDLKNPAGVDILLRLAAGSDVLVEAFRPGVAERLGFGPDVCAERNPRLIYTRMTGWGQDGPLATTAGHDIDYIAVSGTLDPIGREGERPLPPLNLIGDFGGGGMLLVIGVLAALLERERSGLGQVIDVAMVDGSAMLASFLYGLL